jgi:hypothetical protein
MNCPIISPPKGAVKTLTVASLYDANGARGWTGDPINWEGQQAWLSVEPAPKPHMSAYASLTLPWLNTQVQAMAPDVTTARALLDNVQVTPATSLEVPITADSVVVQQGKYRPLKTGDQASIKMLLNDLRRLPIVTPSAVCTGVMKSGPNQAWTITVNKGDKSTLFMLPMAGCKQVTAGTGAVALTNYKFWFDFNSHFTAPRFGSPLCCAPAQTPAPKNAYFFDSESYIYPAPTDTKPKFTREQLLKKLAKDAGAKAGKPQVYLVMSKGPYRGSNAPTLLMWVARYKKALLPMFGCRAFLPGDKQARCPTEGTGTPTNAFLFYDATVGLMDLTIQMDASTAPGRLTFDQWAAKYYAR